MTERELRYPREGERYLDRKPGVLGEVWTCHYEKSHGPGLCEPEWHEIIPETRSKQAGGAP